MDFSCLGYFRGNFTSKYSVRGTSIKYICQYGQAEGGGVEGELGEPKGYIYCFGDIILLLKCVQGEKVKSVKLLSAIDPQII